VVFVATVLATGCGGSGDNGGTPPNTTAIAKTSTNSGDAQNATVGQALPNPLQVLVTESGSPSAGVAVTWSTASGGSLTPASGPTGADGIATSEWTLGTTAGGQTASATLAGASGSPVGFTATAVAAAAATLAKAAGNNGDAQTGEINSPLPLPLQAKVTDQHGNAVQGVPVDWAATGGTVSSPSVASNATGVSAVTVTAGGVIGPIVITATAGTLAGSPLTFNASAVAVTPAPASANVTVGNNLFRSNRNSTTNPAVDTVAVDGTVTWSWVGTGVVTHSVDSEGSPGFTDSNLLTGAGRTYAFKFVAPGRYQYTCSVHPGQMTGTIVVR